MLVKGFELPANKVICLQMSHLATILYYTISGFLQAVIKKIEICS